MMNVHQDAIAVFFRNYKIRSSDERPRNLNDLNNKEDIQEL